MLRYVLAFGILALVGCCPVPQHALPTIAVLDAPGEHRVTGLAEQLQTALLKAPEAMAFGFSSRAALRYHETHRSISGSRAPLQAAFTARSQGALYAVMVGFEAAKTVADTDFSSNKLELTLEASGHLRVTIVSADARVLGTFSSAPVTKRQLKLFPFETDPTTPEGQALLEKLVGEALDDPLAAFSGAHFEEGLQALARPVASELARLISAQASR